VNYNDERRDFMSLVYVTNKKYDTTYVYESINYCDKKSCSAKVSAWEKSTKLGTWFSLSAWR